MVNLQLVCRPGKYPASVLVMETEFAWVFIWDPGFTKMRRTLFLCMIAKKSISHYRKARIPDKYPGNYSILFTDWGGIFSGTTDRLQIQLPAL
jgi:hypothetical protein